MALTRDQKIGLASVGVGAVGLYALRKHQTSSATINPVSTSGSTAAYTPQQPVVLQPGESVYDPNSEGLLTTPKGQIHRPSAPAYVVNVVYPHTHKPHKHTHKARDPHDHKPRKQKAGW